MNEIVRTLPNNATFIVGEFYSKAQSNANSIVVLISTLSLLAVVGLLTAIFTSAFNTRTSKDPHLFVRTHVAVYFISLLVFCFFQAIGGIITTTWVRRAGVFAGSTCTAQGFIKHFSDVGIATWSFAIALNTFFALWRSPRPDREDHVFFGYSISHDDLVKWSTTGSAWFFIFFVVLLGSATASPDDRGDFYGVSGDWCWITDNYRTERVIFAYFFMLLSASVSLCLYGAVFYRLHRKIRVEKPSSNYVINENDQADEYRIMLAKHTAYYPIAYFICILPIAIVRLSSGMSDEVSYGSFIFADFVYLFIGIVNTVLFLCTPRLLPPQTYLPKWVVQFSMPSYDRSTKGASDYDDPYYHKENPEKATASRPMSQITVSSISVPKPVHAPEVPYATPLYFQDRQLNMSPTTARSFASSRRVGLPTRPNDYRLDPAAMDRRHSTVMDRRQSTMTDRRQSNAMYRTSVSTTMSMSKPLPRAPGRRPPGPIHITPSPSWVSWTHSTPSMHAPSAGRSSIYYTRSPSPSEAPNRQRRPSSNASNRHRSSVSSTTSSSYSWAYNFRLSKEYANYSSRPGSVQRAEQQHPYVNEMHEEIDRFRDELRARNSVADTTGSQYMTENHTGSDEGRRPRQNRMSYAPSHRERMVLDSTLYESPTRMEQ